MNLSGLRRSLLPIAVGSLLLLAQAGLSTSAARAATADPAGTFAQPVGRSGPLSAAETARAQLLARLVTEAPGGTPSATTLRSNGFVLVSSPASGTVSAASSNDDVTMDTPYVYFDRNYYRYTAVATYHWDGHHWEKSDGKIGGDDGFALRFDHKMGNNGVLGTFFGRGWYYGTSPVKNPASNNSHGVGYMKQDKAHYLAGGHFDYNMYSGTVTMDIDRPSCGTTIRMYSRYGHSWSSTSLSGIDIGVDSFGLSWSKSSHHWSASSQAGKWTVSC